MDKDFDYFINLVRDMRYWQKLFFIHLDAEDREQAKVFENEVDKRLKEFEEEQRLKAEAAQAVLF